ncbi:unnamed protein product [Blepharisma stoltei]|uniref:Uncharacterized protein n=1 Tax=Blepharisma stoltei TaxID=1481888 RepID=A0AAU9KBD6_9CILI|nr:unnamed protein product [Blepharisma stoltei]
METDTNSLKRKHLESPFEPAKKIKPNLPTPQVFCTPVSIIKNKRLRPKKNPQDTKAEVNFFNTLLNEQRLLQTAPINKYPSPEDKENAESTPISKPSLKEPQTHNSSKENGFFFGRSFHVTGFVHNENIEPDPKLEFPNENNSSLNFGSYNNRILNYRLFTSPLKDQIQKFSE